jgi:hypothetical protein
MFTRSRRDAEMVVVNSLGAHGVAEEARTRARVAQVLRRYVARGEGDRSARRADLITP